MLIGIRIITKLLKQPNKPYKMTLTQHYPQLKKIPQLLTTLLVILLGITLAKLLWMFLTPAESMTVETPITINSMVVKPKKQQNYGKIIADQHLFGRIKKKPVVSTTPDKIDTPPPVAIAPKLNIKLHGIMSYNNKTSGYALLSFNGQPQKVYAVNDSLDKDNKIIVSDVTKEKVTISNHGKTEEFILPRLSTTSSGVAIPANAMNSSIPAANAPHSSMTTLPVAAIRPFVPKAGIQKPNKANAPSIKNMAAFRDQIMADPAKIMEVATAEPFSKDGVFLGFRVSPGKQRRFFRQLGLRNGDVVKEVNGIQMDSAEKGLMLMSEISGASDLNITVLRGTRDIQLPTLHF